LSGHQHRVREHLLLLEFYLVLVVDSPVVSTDPVRVLTKSSHVEAAAIRIVLAAL